MEEILRCTCGNKFMMPLAYLITNGSDLPLEPCEPPAALCPGCQAIWRCKDGVWVKTVSSSTLGALRLMSAEEEVVRG